MNRYYVGSSGTVVINASIIYFDLVVSMFNLWLISIYIDLEILELFKSCINFSLRFLLVFHLLESFHTIRFNNDRGFNEQNLNFCSL